MSDGFSKVFNKKTLQCTNSNLPLASVNIFVALTLNKVRNTD